MAWDPEDGNRSTYKPLTPEQIEKLRQNHVEPRLEIVPSTPTRHINEIGRRPSTPTPHRQPDQSPNRGPSKGIVYH